MAGHEFEGWFPGSVSFDEQQMRGLVICPECGSCEVGKVLMAPAVSRPEKAASLSPEDRMRAMLQLVRRAVEAQCDNVGDQFAAEALRRHNAQEKGDDPSDRGIFGKMSDSDRERLEDEGVEFTSVPWIEHQDS